MYLEVNMNKVFVFILSILLSVAFSQNVYAQEKRGPFYVGFGGSYAIELFDFPEEVSGFDTNFDNTWGLEAKAGYVVVEDLFNIELVYDYLNKFSTAELDLEVHTVIFNLKGYIPAYFEKTGFFVNVGGGWIHGISDGTNSFIDKEDDFCVRLGAGVEHYFIEDLSASFEGNWTTATDDDIGIGDVNFISLTLGLKYHF